MTLTESQISKIFSKNKNTAILTNVFNSLFPKYEINTKNRIAGFLAQCGHESLEFTILKENLNYSAAGLRAVFPKYFPNDIIAADYARKPEKIANRVYANRMLNGPESSGDGWKYRGRGAIQITGKNNYVLFASFIGKSIDETIPYLETLAGACESGMWYFKVNNINSYCDKDDILGMTRRINGGIHGLEARTNLYKKALSVL